MTPAQNKEKQIEMRILITVKGMKGCVSVSMVSAVFQGFIIPAVKTCFMLGFGKSKASVTENVYVIKDSACSQVGNVTLYKWHRMPRCPSGLPAVLAASPARCSAPAWGSGRGTAPGLLQRLLCIPETVTLRKVPGSLWRKSGGPCGVLSVWL